VTAMTSEARLAAAGSRPSFRRLLRQPLRWAGTALRLATLQAVVLGAVLTGSVVALLRTTSEGVKSVAVGQLNAELQSFQQAADSRPAGTDLRSFSTSYLRSHAVANQNLVEVTVPGSWAVANATGSDTAGEPPIEAVARSVPAHTSVFSRRVAGRDLEVLVAPIQDATRQPGVFIATVDLTGLKPAQAAAVRLAIGEGAVALVAGVAIAYLLLRRLLRRIGRITETAEQIGRDRLANRLGDQGTSDEVGQLARSFDSMLDRIESAVNAQHELLSDVSHQLRTPLTVARGHLEILQRSMSSDQREVQETIGVAIAELDRMGRLVERLLDLGRAREPLRDLEAVDLRAFLADFVSSAQVLADRQWVLLAVPDAVVRFDETEVRGALLNLVDNSVRATGPGDVIAVSAAVHGPAVAIAVEDSGPGIPEADRGRVLDRFSRPGGSRGQGSGLGLAIVSAVCRSHGGSVRITDSELGGAAVTMVFRQALISDGRAADRPLPSPVASRSGH
jgi:signal transduction histidine kinase